jgi:hypothetical protein
MAKFNYITETIFGIFGSSLWTTLAVPTYPQNFVNDDKLDEFVRVSVITDAGIVTPSSSIGLIKVEIYTPAGQSIDRAVVISDLLNQMLENKTIGSIQFSDPALVHLDSSIQEEDPTLFKSLYSITFKYYGV